MGGVGPIPKLETSEHNHKILLLVHKNCEIENARWTTRTRDIRRKNASMKITDVITPYVVSVEILNDIKSRFIFSDRYKSIFVVGYRLYGDKWVSRVDVYKWEDFKGIEYFGYICEEQ